ncbi:MAG: diphthine synthase [Candidatus Altiarchaeota archaeon]|nr:diphthine synthase [Candidatus Altiarchaeota archaeon]
MLYLIGMGLEVGDMTLKGDAIIKKCSEVYVEDYTSFPYEVKGAKHLSREDTESKLLIKLAKEKDVALLVGGDPLFATTHMSLILDCQKNQVKYEIIHAPSIMNAILKTGLSPYKFGRIVTISKNFRSDSKRIKSNQEVNLHTLCLIDPVLSAHDALKVLRDMGYESKMILCERLGNKSEKIVYAKLTDLLKLELGARPHSIIIPSKLHFFEEDILNTFLLHK